MNSVSANSGLREAMQKACGERGFKLYVPELKYCGDNAAMIASQAVNVSVLFHEYIVYPNIAA